MIDDDDWFERKLREREESHSSSETDDLDDDLSGDGDSTPESQPEEDADAERDDPWTDEPSGTAGKAAGDDVHEGPFGDDSVKETAGGFGSTDGDEQLEPEDSDGPSESDRSDGPSGGDDADPFGGGDDADPFGGGDDADPFGGGDDADPFGGDAFGFADFQDQDGPEPPTFEEGETEFDSDIERVNVGIDGLDEMILGGVPRRALMSVIGSAGTGKTTFALQFLNAAIEDGEKAVYLTLEESREAILSTAEEKGWPFRRHADQGRLAVVAIDPIDMANSLASIRNDLPRLVADFGADRLVLDSVSLLEMMYDHPARRRSEVFEFTRALKEAGVTTLLTSEASDDNPYTSRYGIVEYLTDAVFVLQYVRSSNYQETRLAVEIQKIRDANHSRETKPYEITNDGISVYRQANIF